MQIIYNAAIFLYGAFIRFASMFNAKARLWLGGREYLIARLPDNSSRLEYINWFHCASLGEFEQGRPLMEMMRKRKPNEKILLTFYSPSGYEIRKDYALADWVTYLPLDRKSKMKAFIDKVQPTRVFIIKYEFWFNMLSVLSEQKIATYLISGKFRKEHVFFQNSGTWFLTILRQSFTHFFVQDVASRQILKDFGIEQVTVTGDTRIDRVLALAQQPKSFPYLEVLLKGKRVVIAGSTWQKEHDFLAKAKDVFSTEMIWIIAPHEVGTAAISALQMKFKDAVLWTDLEQSISCPRVLIVNCIGVLSSLYQYADIAIVGGGFGAGIHNILEPASFGLPVVFGPKHYKFHEAQAMLDLNTGYCIHNEIDFIKALQMLLSSDELLLKIEAKQLNYLKAQSGASDKIWEQIF